MSYLLLKCMSLLSAASVFIIWLGISLFIIGLAYSILKNTWILLRTNAQIKKLPVKNYRLGTCLIDDNYVYTAFTLGILKPRIYISKGLLNSLSNDEIKAVFLHELHHKKNHDPLKFFLGSIIKDLFFYVPIVRYLVRVFHTIREDAADKRVVSLTGKPFELASAIIKVSTFNNKSSYAFASITGAGSVERRIKRLIGERTRRFDLPSVKNILVSFTAMILLLSVPVTITYGFDKKCNTDVCKITHHLESKEVCNLAIGDMNCRVHCNMK